ncbi:hypothetical protein Pryu01_00781 [Paraliobacillus ryukyuensis]|uniref:DNA-binding transcriptional regulator of glucitol operon n=1 Tax=Paraliobacillus ryukyuensis TaxID=200904 RepID=A0A366EF49_9BACI|nr:transcriptional regulator GutM [Paraliobacillus ryukyuensis]RBP00646.1 DNA-binding transcriptional regulator of glucitol operon [Paraliobacillus ryukyuensis]
MELVLIACLLFVIQSVLTFIQVRYYRKSVNALMEQYKGKDGYYLYAAQVRKKLGAGAIVMLVVDQDYTIKECKVMKGMTSLSPFKDEARYKEKHVGHLLEELYQSDKKQKKSTLTRALNQAAENAMLSIASKQKTS